MFLKGMTGTALTEARRWQDYGRSVRAHAAAHAAAGRGVFSWVIQWVPCRFSVLACASWRWLAGGASTPHPRSAPAAGRGWSERGEARSHFNEE